MSGLLLTTAAKIAAALEGRREARQWRCRCPIHGGRSLLVRDGDKGRILVFCHGGCEAHDVLAELRRSGLLGGPAENYQLPAMRRKAGSLRRLPRSVEGPLERPAFLPYDLHMHVNDRRSKARAWTQRDAEIRLGNG